MADRAVFLDRDDTIIDNDGYLGDPSKVKLLPGAGAALAAMRALGYRLIVVSNQSGVARGMFDEAAVDAVNQEMGRQLKETAGTRIDASYYCPYHPEAPVAEYRVDHEWRKPKPGMLKQAAVDFRLELSQCWMVGDMDRDIAAGAAAGCRTIFLHNPELRPDRHEVPTVTPNFVVKTLADAARIIVREGKGLMRPVATAPAAAPVPEAVMDEVAIEDASRASLPASGDASDEISGSPGENVAAIPRRMEMPEGRAEPPVARLEPVVSDGERKMPAAPVAATAIAPPSEAVGAGLAGGHVERQLEELVVQLRQQNRRADLRPDFSLGNMAALIVQFLALAMLILGLVKLVTLKATFTVPLDLDLAILGAMQAVAWIVGAMVLQGIVIALLVHARQK